MSIQRAPLDGRGLYAGFGHARLVCPVLLAADERHGFHPFRWPATWRDPEHDDYLQDLGGHRVADFHYAPGCRPPQWGDVPPCGCGRQLVWADGDPI